MVLDKLGSSLKAALKKVAAAIFVDTRLIDEIVKDLQKALLESDVDVELVFQISERIREKAKKKPAEGISKREQLIQIVYDELTELLGKEKKELVIKKPHKIMFVGLYGSGKTTSIAKLALYYSKRGYKVCMIGLDTHRPAAPEQLQQLGEKIKVQTFISKNERDPLKVWQKYEKQLERFDLILIDTAGRHSLDAELEKEIRELKKNIKPDDIILSLSADIGQAAKKVVHGFHTSCGITGIFLTRLDGTAKAGGALAAANITKAPVLFLGTGEKPQDIETFDSTAFISRLLGMGDLRALLEKTKLALEEKETKKLEKSFEEGKFTLIDLHDQIKAMQKMGPLSKIAELIPGFSQVKLPKDLLQVQEGKLKRWHHAMESMTKKELENPETITSSRMARISKGSAVSSGEIREMLRQYKMVKKFFGITKGKKMSQKALQRIAKKFKFKM